MRFESEFQRLATENARCGGNSELRYSEFTDCLRTLLSLLQLVELRVIENELPPLATDKEW